MGARMTAIVGLVDSGIVYIGGDSAGASGWSLTVRADAKVFFNAGYLFGFTTSYRMGQLIRYALQPPEPARDLERFMATTFIDAIRTCLKEGGWAKKDNDREEGGTFLVGVRGRLFTVYDDYQVAEAAAGVVGWSAMSVATGPVSGGGAAFAAVARCVPSHGGVQASSAGRAPGNVRPASRTRTGTSSRASARRVVINVGSQGTRMW